MKNRYWLLALLVPLITVPTAAANADSPSVSCYSPSYSWSNPSYLPAYSTDYWLLHPLPQPVIIYVWVPPERDNHGWGPIYNWYGCGAPALTYTLGWPQPFWGWQYSSQPRPIYPSPGHWGNAWNRWHSGVVDNRLDDDTFTKGGHKAAK